MTGSLPPAVAATDSELTLGIRPEHLMLTDPVPNATIAQVDLIELVGPVTYLDLSVGDRSLRASVSAADYYDVGQQVAVAFDAGNAHFFDRATGVRITG